MIISAELRPRRPNCLNSATRFFFFVNVRRRLGKTVATPLSSESSAAFRCLPRVGSHSNFLSRCAYSSLIDSASHHLPTDAGEEISPRRSCKHEGEAVAIVERRYVFYFALLRTTAGGNTQFVISTVKLRGCTTPFAVAFTTTVWLPAGGKLDAVVAELEQPVIVPTIPAKSSKTPA
jgi:hypothetical protein